MPNPEYLAIAVGTAMGVPATPRPASVYEPKGALNKDQLLDLVWTAPIPRNIEDRMSAVEQGGEDISYIGLPVERVGPGDGAEGVTVMTYRNVSVTDGFKLLQLMSDDLAWSGLTWRAVGLPRTYRPTAPDFKVIVIQMATEVCVLVRELGLDQESERRVVEAIENWGQAIGELAGPNDLGEQVPVVHRFASDAMVAAGHGATRLGEAMWAVTSNPTVAGVITAATAVYLSNRHG
jgi:hypothetical protein